jgi:hypothetical protein
LLKYNLTRSYQLFLFSNGNDLTVNIFTLWKFMTSQLPFLKPK